MFTELESDFIDTDELSEDVTYTPYGGDPVSIPAVVNDDFPNQQDYANGLLFATAILHIHNSRVAAVNHRDRFTFHGYEWEMSSDAWQRQGDFYIANLVRMIT